MMRRATRTLAGCATAVLLLGAASPVLGQSGNTDDTRPASSTFLGDTGLWLLPSAETLPAGRGATSVQLLNYDRQEGITDISHVLGTAAFGVNDRFELFGSVRASTRVDRDVRPVFSPEPFGGPSYELPLMSDQFSSTIGDVLIGGKFDVASEARQQAAAFAIRTVVKVPTGSEQHGTTTGKVDGMLDLIVSKTFGDFEVAGFGGYALRGDPTGIDLPNSLRWGIGTGVSAWPAMTLYGELSGEILSDSSLSVMRSLTAHDGSMVRMMSDVRGPIDATLGLQWRSPNGLSVGTGVNYSMLHKTIPFSGVGGKLGLLVRIGYHPGAKVYVPPPPPAPPPPPNQPPTASAQCDPCELETGQESQVRANASDPDGDPLTFQWSTPAGTFQGPQNLETARWQAPGDAGPVPVTVTVEDGRGGTVSDTVTITVNAPPPPPRREYVFEDVHFDFDRYTLRVGAAQVLDEVVAAMNEDDALRIQIEGHTCNIGTAEYNLALSERRASAVQSYLSDRGVSPDRLETVSYGEERPGHDNSREETRRLNRRAALVVRLVE